MTGSRTEDQYKLERRVALFTGVAVVLFVLYLVFRNEPFADPNLVVIVRIVLSLAIGTVGATIPGFLHVQYNAAGFALRAAGALALFVISFFGTPEVQALGLKPIEVSYQREMDVRESGCGADGKPIDVMVVTDTITFSGLKSDKFVASALRSKEQTVEVYDLNVSTDRPLNTISKTELYKGDLLDELKWNINVIYGQARVRYKWENPNFGDPGLGTFSPYTIKELEITVLLPQGIEIRHVLFEPDAVKEKCIFRPSGRITCSDVNASRVVARWDWNMWEGCE